MKRFVTLLLYPIKNIYGNNTKRVFIDNAYKKQTVLFSTLKYISYEKSNAGHDERYPSNVNDTSYTSYNSRIAHDIEKIRINYKKKNVLDSLESGNVPMAQKLILIEEMFGLSSIKPPSLTAGGLFKDFNMDI
jgi:hypothetical protein